MELSRIIPPPGSKPLEDNTHWTNRFEIKSESSSRLYIIAQHKTTGLWGCSCPSYRTRRTCKHLNSLNLPQPQKLLPGSREKKAGSNSKDFLSGYKHFDVQAESYGNTIDWEAAFNARMGLGQARRVVGTDSTFLILGLSLTASWTDVRSAYRKLVRQHHPDAGGNAAEFRRVQAAFEILEDKYKKGLLC